MKQTNYKRVPFDIELAKKITNNEVKGRIVNGNGKKLRIICFDRMGNYPIVALAEMPDGVEDICTYTANGQYDEKFKSKLNLHIEVPTYYRDYSNFKPRKWQQCVVRQGDDDIWGILVYSHRSCLGEMLFYNEDGFVMPFANALPLTERTSRLIGTSKSYEEVIKYLDVELTKNDQQ